MQELIEALGALEGVRGALLTSRDGLVIASTLPNGTDDELYAALTAALYGAMDRTTERIGLGQTIDSMVQTKDYALQMLGLEEFVLVVISDKLMNIEEVRKSMRRLAREVVVSSPAA